MMIGERGLATHCSGSTVYEENTDKAEELSSAASRSLDPWGRPEASETVGSLFGAAEKRRRLPFSGRRRPQLLRQQSRSQQRAAFIP